MTVADQAWTAVYTAIDTALPMALVLRNEPLPQQIPADGLALVNDGTLGDPEITFGVRTYYFDDAVTEVTLYAAAELEVDRRTEARAMIDAVTEQVTSDRTLGGVVDWAEPVLQAVDHDAFPGAQSVAAATMLIQLRFQGSGPTG